MNKKSNPSVSKQLQGDLRDDQYHLVSSRQTCYDITRTLDHISITRMFLVLTVASNSVLSNAE